MTIDQIVELPTRYNDPAIVFKDGGNAFVVITDMTAPNKAGVEKSVMVRLTEQTRKSGERLFLASAYSREADKEYEYVRLANTPGAAVYCNKNKVAALMLEQGTKSTLQSLAGRDDVVTPEGLTARIIPYPAPSAQVARSSVRRAKNLMAVKNLSAKDLLADLERGSLINPSIGIIAPGTQFTEYGEITLVLDKNAITADTAIWEGDRGKKELADSSQAHIRVRPTMKEPTLLERQAPPLRQKQSRRTCARGRDRVNLTHSSVRRRCEDRGGLRLVVNVRELYHNRRIRARPRCAPPSVVFGAWVLGAFAASPLVRGAWRKRNDRLATSL